MELDAHPWDAWKDVQPFAVGGRFDDKSFRPQNDVERRDELLSMSSVRNVNQRRKKVKEWRQVTFSVLSWNKVAEMNPEHVSWKNDWDI